MNKMNYWEERYKKGETGWDAGAITPPLKEYIDQLTDKNLRILIPGAGNGYEFDYLIENGFQNVFVVEISLVPFKSKSLNSSLDNLSFKRRNVAATPATNGEACEEPRFAS